MYTFQALDDITTATSHEGYIFVVALICIVVFFIIANEDDVEMIRGTMSIAFGVLIISALISWNTGDTIKYTNAKVTATFVGFQAEGYNEETHPTIKTTSRVDHHNTYVIYAVPEGNVMFPAAAGQVYPRTAVLYKN